MKFIFYICKYNEIRSFEKNKTERYLRKFINPNFILSIIFYFCLFSCKNRITFLLNTSFLEEKTDCFNIDESFCWVYKIDNDLAICSGYHFLINNRITCANLDDNIPHMLMKRYSITYPDDFPLISRFIEQAIHKTQSDNVEIILENYFYDDFLYLLDSLNNPDNIIGSLKNLDASFILKFLMKFDIVYSKYLKTYLKSLSASLFLHYVCSNKFSEIDFSMILTDETNTSLIVVFVQQFLKFYFVKFEMLKYFIPAKNPYFYSKKEIFENLLFEKTQIKISPTNLSSYNFFLNKSFAYESLRLLLNAIKIKKLVFDCLIKKLNWNRTKFANLIPLSCIKIKVSICFADKNFLKYIYPLLKRPTTKKLKLYVHELSFEAVEFLKKFKNLENIYFCYDTHVRVQLLEKILELIKYMPNTHISLVLCDSIIGSFYSLPEKYLNNIDPNRLTLYLTEFKKMSYLIYRMHRILYFQNSIEKLMISTENTFKSTELRILKGFKNLKNFLYIYKKGDHREYLNQKFDFLKSFISLKRIRLFNIIINRELLCLIFYSKSLMAVYFDRVEISEALKSRLNLKGENIYLKTFVIHYSNRAFNRNLLEYLEYFTEIKSIQISVYDYPNDLISFDLVFYNKKDKILDFFNPEFASNDFLYLKKISMARIKFISDSLNDFFEKKWNLSKLRKLILEAMVLSMVDMVFLSSLGSISNISFNQVKFHDCCFTDFLSHHMLKKIEKLYLCEIFLIKSDLIKFSYLKNIKYLEFSFAKISDKNLSLLQYWNLKNIEEFRLHVKGLNRKTRISLEEFYSSSFFEIIYNR